MYDVKNYYVLVHIIKKRTLTSFNNSSIALFSLNEVLLTKRFKTNMVKNVIVNLDVERV